MTKNYDQRLLNASERHQGGVGGLCSCPGLTYNEFIPHPGT